jgi:hypothetical protein
MAVVDSALVDLTEWWCRKFQLWTGRSNVWLAFQLTILSIIVYFVWAGLYFLIIDPLARVVLGLFCVGLFYVLTQTIFKVPIEAYEASAYQRVAQGLRNPRRLRDAPLRIAFLTLAVLLAYPIGLVYATLRLQVVLLTYSLIVLTTIVLYLLACDPLPPCRGRLWEWWRAARPVLRRGAAGAGDAVPSPPRFASAVSVRPSRTSRRCRAASAPAQSAPRR